VSDRYAPLEATVSMEQANDQPADRLINRSCSRSSSLAASDSVASDHGGVDESPKRLSAQHHRGLSQLSIRSATAVDTDATFDQFHIRGRQRSDSITIRSDGIVDLDELFPRLNLRARRRSRSSSIVDLLESDPDIYVYPPDSPLSADSRHSSDVSPCSECGNLLPELSERPRGMSLAGLSQSADRGCNDCELLVAGYEAYARRHPAVARDTAVRLRSLNTGGPLRLRFEYDDNPIDTVLEFYTAAGE
jgi:hypothetical protein